MKIRKNKYIDQQHNRISFHLENFEYVDGGDLIAKLFQMEYGFQIGEKTPGIWSRRLRIYKGAQIYEIYWHEDLGNEIYSLDQTKETISRLEEQLDHVLAVLNSKIERAGKSI